MSIASDQAPAGTRTGGDLRVAVVGAGMMGSDHIQRVTQRIHGAQVAAVIELDPDRAAAASAAAPGAVARIHLEEALERDSIDAVLIATPGHLHEAALFAALDADVAIFCEKPLTSDPESALRVLDAEQRLHRPRIQVGFMRRFDQQYQQLRELVASDELGALLGVHCAHRNPAVVDSYTEPMLITEAVVHEIDIVPWLAGSDVVSVENRPLRRNSASHIADPALVLLELENGVLADVEVHMNIRSGYQVKTEAVFERGTAEIGKTSGMNLFTDARISVAEHTSFVTRFTAAYDQQIQRWVDAATRGTIDGASAWDGYRAAVVCEAAIAAQRTRGTVEVPSTPRPAFYAISSLGGSTADSRSGTTP